MSKLYTPVSNKLKVLHYPQIPCKPFEVEVENEREAHLVLNTLANQHLFLFKNNMIPDYANIMSVVMWDEDSDGEGTSDWVDYWNEAESMEWDEFEDTYFNPQEDE